MPIIITGLNAQKCVLTRIHIHKATSLQNKNILLTTGTEIELKT